MNLEHFFCSIAACVDAVVCVGVVIDVFFFRRACNLFVGGAWSKGFIQSPPPAPDACLFFFFHRALIGLQRFSRNSCPFSSPFAYYVLLTRRAIGDGRKKKTHEQNKTRKRVFRRDSNPRPSVGWDVRSLVLESPVKPLGHSVYL